MAQEAPVIEKDWKKGWKLYYWQRFGGPNGNPMGGRGAPIRVMFELGGAEWEEACKDKNPTEVAKDILGPNAKLFPNFAFPIVSHNDNVVLSQSTNIILFLGDVLGLAPDNIVERAYANQIQLTIYDTLLEVSYKRREIEKEDKKTQEEKDQALNNFLDTRFSSFLEVIEQQLKRNNEGKGWFFGDKVTFADVQANELMRKYEHGSPEHYKNSKFKLLKEHHKRFLEIDKVKAYYASNRCPKCF